jgi:hypothetical protein
LHQAGDEAAVRMICNQILEDIHHITSELFAAFENEYTVFNPMQNCFEIFGLDFLIDESYQVSLLEVSDIDVVLVVQHTNGKLFDIVI